MFRTLVEQTCRFRIRTPLALSRRTTLRGGAVLATIVIAALLVVAAAYAPRSARANLALCLRSLAGEPSVHGKIDSRESKALAIEHCID